MTYQPVIVQPESNCAFSHCSIYIQFETWGHMYICSVWIQSLCKLQAYFIACILRQLLVFCLLRLLFMSQWWWNSRSRLDHQIMTTRRRPPCLYLPTLLRIYIHKWNKMYQKRDFSASNWPLELTLQARLICKNLRRSLLFLANPT